MILDGKIIPADRCREKTVSVRGDLIDVWYSGKTHAHGGSIQAVIAPDGFRRTLQHITASPSKIGDIARAALILTHVEHGYINLNR